MQLEDGTGKGNLAKIGDDNRLHTISLIEFPIESFAHGGNVFTLSSDFVSLTNIATHSGLMYVIQNSTTHNLHLETIRTTSTQPTLWRLIKNPTTGTLISGGTVLAAENTNFGSGRTLNASAKKGTGAAGLTVTDGTLVGQWMTSAYNPYVYLLQGSLVLTTGDTLALTCLPSVNPTSVGTTFTAWEEAFGARGGR